MLKFLKRFNSVFQDKLEAIFEDKSKSKSKSKSEFESEFEAKFQKIIKDLETQKAIPYEKIQNEEYTKRISADEHQKLFENLIDILQSNNDIKKQLVETGEYRLSKDKFPLLPRTIQIVKNKDNSFMTIIEAKSKLAGGKTKDPNKAKQPQGTFKRAKPAFVVPPTETNPSKQKIMGDEEYCYVSLGSNITQLQHDKNTRYIEAYKNIIRRETALSHETDATVKLNCAFHYNSLNQVKSNCYAKKGTTLASYLASSTLYKSLTNAHKQQMFYSLLKEIHTLHNAGIIHQDIKPDNIIIYYDSNSDKYEAKLTDLGVCSKLRPKEAIATAGYESPEMIESRFFESKYVEYQKTNGQFNTIAYMFANKPYDKSCTTPHEKNDMWAIGIVYLFLMYNRKAALSAININSYKPELEEILKNNDLWIKGLLNPNREKRMSINEAILNIDNSIFAIYSQNKHLAQPENEESLVSNMKRAV